MDPTQSHHSHSHVITSYLLLITLLCLFPPPFPLFFFQILHLLDRGSIITHPPTSHFVFKVELRKLLSQNLSGLPSGIFQSNTFPLYQHFKLIFPICGKLYLSQTQPNSAIGFKGAEKEGVKNQGATSWGNAAI